MSENNTRDDNRQGSYQSDSLNNAFKVDSDNSNAFEPKSARDNPFILRGNHSNAFQPSKRHPFEPGKETKVNASGGSDAVPPAGGNYGNGSVPPAEGYYGNGAIPPAGGYYGNGAVPPARGNNGNGTVPPAGSYHGNGTAASKTRLKGSVLINVVCAIMIIGAVIDLLTGMLLLTRSDIVDLYLGGARGLLMISGVCSVVSGVVYLIAAIVGIKNSNNRSKCGLLFRMSALLLIVVLANLGVVIGMSGVNAWSTGGFILPILYASGVWMNLKDTGGNLTLEHYLPAEKRRARTTLFAGVFIGIILAVAAGFAVNRQLDSYYSEDSYDYGTASDGTDDTDTTGTDNTTGTDQYEESAEETVTSSSSSSSAVSLNGATITPDTVLVDQNGIKITAVDFEYDDLHQCDALKLRVENNTDQDVFFSSEEVKINNSLTLPNYVAMSVDAGESQEDYLDLESGYLQMAGIDKLGQIDITYYVEESENYDPIFTPDSPLTIKTNYADEMSEAASVQEGTEIYNDNGVRVVAVGRTSQSVDLDIMLYVENNTDSKIWFYVDSAEVDGTECNAYTTSSIDAGCKGFDPMTIYDTDNSMDFTEASSCTVTLTEYNESDSTTTWTSDPITIDVSSLKVVEYY